MIQKFIGVRGAEAADIGGVVDLIVQILISNKDMNIVITAATAITTTIAPVDVQIRQTENVV